jgi:multiple sugar transport system permease protein
MADVASVRARAPGRMAAVYVALGVLVVINVAPWLWMWMAAFKTRAQVLSPNPQWLFSPTFENFPEVLLRQGFLDFLRNSLIVAVGTLALCLLVGVPAAYAFSRFRIPGGKHLFFFILSTRMAPPVVIALPLYLLFSNLGILATHGAVILAHTTFTLAFVVWMMKGFFDEMPTAIEAAAMTDGYTRFQAFRKVILPVAKPGIVATSTFAFLFSWNEFLLSLVLAGQGARTLPAAFPGLVTPHGTYWGQVAAAGAVVTIPVLILVFLLQRHLVRGLSFGAVTG